MMSVLRLGRPHPQPRIATLCFISNLAPRTSHLIAFFAVYIFNMQTKVAIRTAFGYISMKNSAYYTGI